jgi:transcriptional regulator with XRE-family HTH domain
MVIGRQRRTQTEAEMARIIGERLRELRLLQGMTQTELGKAAGVGFSQVQRLERGVHNMTPWKLMRFAEALGVSMNELMGQGQIPKGDLVSRMMIDAVRDLNEIERESPEMFATICKLIRTLLAEKAKRVQPKK